MSYQQIPPPQLPRGIVPVSRQQGMGLALRITQNDALNTAIFWAFILGAGYLALSFGYEGITGHKLLPTTRTPAAWELA
jgi:hypothetical protein